MHQSTLLSQTVEPMLREQEPNFLRLYLNPRVAQTCFCLDHYVRTTWPGAPVNAPVAGEPSEVFQSFLANSLEEAIGGAIKLVRFNRGPVAGRRAGLILDPADRLVGFADLVLASGERVEFLPDLHVLGKKQLSADGDLDLERSLGAARETFVVDPIILVAGVEPLESRHAAAIRQLMQHHRSSLIVAVNRASLAAMRSGGGGLLREMVPDVVVFDESFVDHAVPFAAFTARKSLFAAWNRPKKSTFHSTTFQPNTISARHFVNCAASSDPEFFAAHSERLQGMETDLRQRGDAFRRYYSPALYRLIRAAGFETADIKAAGSFVVVNGRRIYDTVGGVACSVRGHNPPTYVEELTAIGPETTLEGELCDRFRRLTGLGHILPAVSGATAVENALRLALVARFPRRHILALAAGFGGKTLLSLTGTSNPFYKENVGPLHAEVHYVDPFAHDAPEQVDALMKQHEFAAVQVELIQSVGGVRRIPETLVRHLDEGRARHGYVLIVDEVQTGMYRTGPFCQSETFGLTPDVMLLGKGTSDMMFPFALTLFSDAIAQVVGGRGPTLLEAVRGRYGYEVGYQTVVNVLRRAERVDLSRQVTDAGVRFNRLLTEGLASIGTVRDVRVFGLLIAIELNAHTGPRRWLRKRLGALYLLAMMQHARFPLLAGFCQYEPNTLKITPPLDTSTDDTVQACLTIIDVLGRPFHKVLLAGLLRLLRPTPVRKGTHERWNYPAPELAAH